MATVLVIVVAISKELALKIDPIPEEQLIAILAPQRTDKTFDERMRLRHKGNSLNLGSVKLAGIRAP